jgi:hypothetical protein
MGSFHRVAKALRNLAPVIFTIFTIYLRQIDRKTYSEEVVDHCALAPLDQEFACPKEQFFSHLPKKDQIPMLFGRVRFYNWRMSGERLLGCSLEMAFCRVLQRADGYDYAVVATTHAWVTDRGPSLQPPGKEGLLPPQG